MASNNLKRLKQQDSYSLTLQYNVVPHVFKASENSLRFSRDCNYITNTFALLIHLRNNDPISIKDFSTNLAVSALEP